MEKISVSIPTIIKNTNIKKQPIKRGKKKEKDAPSSVAIFQHNNLVEARYSLTLQEKRLILWLISKIQPDEADFKKHELSVKEFMKLMDLKGNANYKELQKITLGLMKKVLVIKRPIEKTLTQVNWINYAHYEEGSGKIEVSFSDVMKPFLLHLKGQFTAIEVTDLMQFTSIHAIRIYELLKQYENIGERTLSIDDIKDCCGVKDKLSKYSSFEKDLLLIAQREINSKSDIHFEFERIKPSRKITGIKFLISKNKAYNSQNASTIQTTETTRKPPLYYQLEEFGLSKRIINTLIKDNEEQTIENAIKCIEIQSTRTLVRNPRAMLLSAIKEQWHPDKYKLKQ
jgi:plasmid replication initiation protein